MIKCESGNLRGDYTSSGYVTTDHKTVGPFITEAAEIYSDLTVTIDGVKTFEIKDHAKVKISDNREIDSVTYVSGWNDVNLLIKTKPKPKYVNYSGYVNIYKLPNGQYQVSRYVMTKEAAEQVFRFPGADKNMIVDTIRIEWKEKL